jgi:DNA-binding PadR family transcriptional regulator
MTPVPDVADEASRHLPLSPRVFQILMSLADVPRHGYAVIRDVEERTGGTIRLTASTLYDALARLDQQGWIEEVRPPADGDDHDPRRRYYRLSELGREVARQEARRLERALQTARERRLLPKRARK